jgi:hypothetical protein
VTAPARGLRDQLGIGGALLVAVAGLALSVGYGVQVLCIACAAVAAAVLGALLAVRVVPRDVQSHRFGAGAVDARGPTGRVVPLRP